MVMLDAPAAGPRSPAHDRRLRQLRQNARLRLRLVADVALLSAHHASHPPVLVAAPLARAGPGWRHEAAALREQITDLRALVVALMAAHPLVAVEELLPATPSAAPAATSMDVEVEGGAPGQASVETAEVEEAHQVLSGDERKASAVAALLSAIESRQVESLQLALTVAEAAGLEDQDQDLLRIRRLDRDALEQAFAAAAARIQRTCWLVRWEGRARDGDLVAIWNNEFRLPLDVGLWEGRLVAHPEDAPDRDLDEWDLIDDVVSEFARTAATRRR